MRACPRIFKPIERHLLPIFPSFGWLLVDIRPPVVDVRWIAHSTYNGRLGTCRVLALDVTIPLACSILPDQR